MSGNTVVWFRGVRIDKRTRAMIWEAESRSKFVWDMIQGSPSYASASALTHAKGGVFDAWPRGVSIFDLDEAWRSVRRLRDVGGFGWVRTPDQGFTTHIHCGVLGAPNLSCPPGSPDYGYGAWAQQDEYLATPPGDGLAGAYADAHPYRPDPPVEFDYAAWLAKQRRVRMHLRALREKIRRAERQTRRLRKQLKHTH
jgi:hypothetical protein